MANIIELIKNIRNAHFGKDVRESIASSIEQCYEDASKSGNANMEVSEARGSYDTLKKRLDNTDIVKADKTTTDNLQNQINSLASGSPLVASSISEMTDTTRIYVNINDGHWYTYNGTSWVDGGPYQATEIADESIIPEKTSFLKNINRNLFNGNYVKGRIANNGEYTTIAPNENYFTAFVNVSPNELVSINKAKTTQEQGYWYLQYCELDITAESAIEILRKNLTIESGHIFNFVNKSSNTDEVTNAKILTSENTKCIAIKSALTNTPYLEVLVGDYNKLIFNTYNPIFAPYEVDIYNKSEVNNLIRDNINNLKNKVTLMDNILTITLKNIKFTFKRHIVEGRALDTWRITGFELPTGVENTAEIECPIHEKNAIDFIGGQHGDEEFESIFVLIDGKEITLDADFNVYFSNLTIFVKSKLFHCNTKNQCFTRYKKLEFSNNKLIISNRLICTDKTVVDRYTGCGLLAIYDRLFDKYSNNIQNTIVDKSSSFGIYSKNKNLNEGVFYGKGFTISLKPLKNNYQEYYCGFMQHFNFDGDEQRTKFYFDAINDVAGVTINVDDEIITSYEIEVS